MIWIDSRPNQRISSKASSTMPPSRGSVRRTRPAPRRWRSVPSGVGRAAMRRTRSPMRSRACTAVVGSLTAGDRARSAMSTSWRSPKPTSWYIVRLAARSTGGSGRCRSSRRRAVDLEQRLALGHVHAHRAAHDARTDRRASAQSARRSRSTAAMTPLRGAGTTLTGRVARSSGGVAGLGIAGGDRRRAVVEASGREGGLDRAPGLGGDGVDHVHGPDAAGDVVHVEQEGHQAGPDEHERDAHLERHGLVAAATQLGRWSVRV